MTHSPGQVPAFAALERIAAAKSFVDAAAEELDDAIMDARSSGCQDKDIAPFLGQTSEAIRQRRVRIAGRRLAGEPADAGEM